ncbi:hypothetical protein HYDPIDRAFT_44315, partial [Hydnomerulius pinastri MD-312]
MFSFSSSPPDANVNTSPPSTANAGSTSTPATSDTPTTPETTVGLKSLPGTPRSEPVPKWIPITLLAFSSAAMVLPVVMLRRYRASLGGRGSSPMSSVVGGGAPPRRGRGKETGFGEGVGDGVRGAKASTSAFVSTAPPPRRICTRGHAAPPPTTTSPPSSPSTHIQANVRAATPTRIGPSRTEPKDEPTMEQDGFNAPLYTLKAF